MGERGLEAERGARGGVFDVALWEGVRSARGRRLDGAVLGHLVYELKKPCESRFF